MFLTMIVLFFFNNAHAINWEVRNVCQDATDHRGEFLFDIEKLSVGEITVAILEKEGIPYVGDASGIAVINNTPKGEDAVQFLEDGRMRAFGWCYSVDGIAPDVMPGDYKFPNQNSKLIWWFGFSTLTNGEWIGYCDPSYLAKWKKLCGDLP